MTRRDTRAMGALTEGQTVAIIGGGPAGLACAMTLQREAELRHVRLRVLVFEGKHFELHYNQCAGVLSPPLLSMLRDDYDILLPPELIQQEITGYVLHSQHDCLALSGAEHGGRTLAVRRVEFDNFLEQCAIERGVQIHHQRVTDLEFRDEDVIIFTWNGTFRADVVVGAFGLSKSMAATFSTYTSYRAPQRLEALVTKVDLDERETAAVDLLDNRIQVMLPALPHIEFGALIPKGNHITIIVAGKKLTTADLSAFLALPPIARLLPHPPAPSAYFKGRFPTDLAPGAFGDRYVTIGDAAGLVRPFKGKGINSAMISGRQAALTMLDTGISREAFRTFWRRCDAIVGDIPYGRLVRLLAFLTAHQLSMDAVIRQARKDPILCRLLFDSVSGQDTYRNIVCCPGNLSRAMKVGLVTVLNRLRHGVG